MQQYEKRVAADYEWTEGEIEWTPRNTIVYPLICSLAGATFLLCSHTLLYKEGCM